MKDGRIAQYTNDGTFFVSNKQETLMAHQQQDNFQKTQVKLSNLETSKITELALDTELFTLKKV